MNLLKNILGYNYILNSSFKLKDVIQFSNSKKFYLVQDEIIELMLPEHYGNEHYEHEMRKLRDFTLKTHLTIDDHYDYKGDHYGNDFEYDNTDVCKEYHCKDKTTFFSIFDLPLVISDDAKIWYKYNKIHRDRDYPAIIVSGDVEIMSDQWWKYGKLHRDNDLPASIILTNDGDIIEIWYQFGLRHRIDKAAVIYGIGPQEWWLNGKLHRDNDLPAVVEIYNNYNDISNKMWYQNGLLHRDGNVAAELFRGEFHEFTFTQIWSKNGILYRSDEKLPVIHITNNTNFKSYYLEGNIIRKLESRVRLTIESAIDVARIVADSNM